MLPGAVGSRWMPRKIAGIAMITIEVSIVAISMLTVVFESATHLYLLSGSCGLVAGTAKTLAWLRIYPGRALAVAAEQVRVGRGNRCAVVGEGDIGADAFTVEYQRHPVPGVVPHAVEWHGFHPEPPGNDLIGLGSLAGEVAGHENISGLVPGRPRREDEVQAGHVLKAGHGQ